MSINEKLYLEKMNIEKLIAENGFGSEVSEALKDFSNALPANWESNNEDIDKLAIVIKDYSIHDVKNEIYFRGSLVFERCEFLGELQHICATKISFTGCNFKEKMHIKNSIGISIKELNFVRCTISKNIIIDAFNADLQLTDTIIKHHDGIESLFFKTNLLKIAALKGKVQLKINSRSTELVKVDADELILTTQEGAESTGINIDKSRFSGKSEFKNVKFSKNAIFENSIFFHIQFDGCVFLGYTSFNSSTFNSAPIFNFENGVSINRNTTFSGAVFKGFGGENTGSYRYLKQMQANAHNEEECMRFSALEMSSRFKGLKLFSGDWFEVFCSLFARISNNYGFALERPLYGLVTIFFCCTVIYWYSGCCVINKRLLMDNNLFPRETWPHEIMNLEYKIGPALYFAFINTFIPIRFFLTENLVVAKNLYGLALVIIQGAFSSVLWYQLIIGVKKRFRQN